jgi:maltooligosyltrehalose trehalohydrolase
MRGERLSRLVDYESLKLAMATALLSPFIPLLFMGEEYGEVAPFLYFVNHSDPELVEAVREGRKKEFATFQWSGPVPNPDDLDTFMQSKIQWELGEQGAHQVLKEFTRELINLRRMTPPLSHLSKDRMKVEGWEQKRLIIMKRWEDATGPQSLCIFNFNTKGVQFPFHEFPLQGVWRKCLDSSEEKWLGGKSRLPDELSPGDSIELARRSVAVYLRGED